MKPRDYCCCAIPMVNVGIYATLTEQFILALVVAILALATPKLVGASVPSFASLVLAIICFVACAVQVLGFMGVIRESPVMFRRYTTLHSMATLAAFSVSLAWIIISATKHNAAVAVCENTFFANSTAASNATSLNEGQTLCNIFTWVDVGIMGGLWVVLAIMQLYLYTVISAYGTGQRVDHALASESDIPLEHKVWNSRGHLRNKSDASRVPMLGQPEPIDQFSRQDTVSTRHHYGDSADHRYPAHTPNPHYDGYGYDESPWPDPRRQHPDV